ncbi:TPR-like protein [Polychaeton citri CBS 116435]|uniref:TPR-like protein n=1 Tax=Polychaeton citri CBS 116435 TaxID=1314669 RepID=A0A9P4Q1F7_9PEZI|nr:TPR-like protein [Polychaeton citri CBS 116435]
MLRWMDGRNTTREEDMSYCLLGLFDIDMTVRYGGLEAGKRTRDRFLAKVDKRERSTTAANERPMQSESKDIESRLRLLEVSSVPIAKSLETPLIPSSNVPFPRDADFINRGTLMQQIDAKLTLPARRVALVGLGGVGKSQLAIEYSYRERNKSPGTWTLWIHASNATRFEQSVRDIADLVHIYGRDDPKANIFALFRGWLRDLRRGKWLIILDNADDVDFLFQKEATTGCRPLDCLPVCEYGSILVTTRSKDAALKLVEHSNMIVVNPMDEEDAVALLEKKLEAKANVSELRGLASTLEYMPLAVTQAAAYINQKRGRCSVQQYFDKIRKSDRSKKSILDDDAGDLRRDSEARNSIVLTWQISFEHIYDVRPSAAELLLLMSFCDHQAIPELLLRAPSNERDAYVQAREQGNLVRNNESGDDIGYGGSGKAKTDPEDATYLDDSDDSTSPDSLEDIFDGDIAMLEGFSFVSITADTSAFKMHRLVQLSTQRWLAAQGQLEQWKERYVKSLYAVFPPGHYENWETCKTLLPHSKAASALKLRDLSVLLQWASVMHYASWYAQVRGTLTDAEEMCLQCMEVRSSKLGAEHPNTLDSMDSLASIYQDQGRWTEAEQLQVKVLETRRTTLGQEHPDTLASMNNLALMYGNQGRWTEAEQLQVKVLETRRTMLGQEHPDTLASTSNLAVTYQDQGRWKKAEQLQVKVLETRRKALGLEHPSTLTSMSNLALTYWYQGRWVEAERLQVKELKMTQRMLGLDHPDTLTSMSNLALTYGNQGRWKEAEQLQVKVLETRRTMLGQEHPDTLTSMSNLAVTYENQGRWKEAEQLQVKVTETSR